MVHRVARTVHQDGFELKELRTSGVLPRKEADPRITAAQHAVTEAEVPATCPVRETCKFSGPLPAHTVSKGQKWRSDSRLSGLHFCLRQMLQWREGEKEGSDTQKLSLAA